MARVASPVPDWLAEYVQDARGLFGLGGPEWAFRLRLVDSPGGNRQAAAMVWPDYTYLNAQIDFRRDCTPGDEWRENAWHEVMHVALAELSEIFEEAVSELPEARQARLIDRYDSAEERAIQRTVRNILARLEPMEEAEDG